MKIEIKSRRDASVLFTADISEDTHPAFHVREALKVAVDSGADLSRADLSGAIGADFAIAQTRILPEVT